jgi:hypothetical protein
MVAIVVAVHTRLVESAAVKTSSNCGCGQSIDTDGRSGTHFRVIPRRRATSVRHWGARGEPKTLSGLYYLNRRADLNREPPDYKTSDGQAAGGAFHDPSVATPGSRDVVGIWTTARSEVVPVDFASESRTK